MDVPMAAVEKLAQQPRVNASSFETLFGEIAVFDDDHVGELGFLLLPMLYMTCFICFFVMPERATMLEWLRREHIQELMQMSTIYKPKLNDDGWHDECVLCLEQFESGAEV